MYALPNEPPPPSAQEEQQPATARTVTGKVTQRILKIRALIETGEYPNRDELAERIVDKL